MNTCEHSASAGERTKLLLHVVDVSCMDPERDPVQDMQTIANELSAHNPELAARERWLVLNKIDLVVDRPEDDWTSLCAEAGWEGPVYAVSGATGEGCETLMLAVQAHLLAMAESDGETDE